MKFIGLVLLMSFFIFGQTKIDSTLNKTNVESNIKKIEIKNKKPLSTLYLNTRFNQSFSDFDFSYSRILLGNFNSRLNIIKFNNTQILNTLQTTLRRNTNPFGKILATLSTAAAVYLAGKHLLKYWDNYKEDFGEKKKSGQK